MIRRLSPTEIHRAALHAVGGLLIVIFTLIVNVQTTLIILTIFAIAWLIANLLMKHGKTHRWLAEFDRKSSIKHIPGRGGFWYLIGVILALVLFGETIGLAAILILAFGDAFASIANSYGTLKTVLHDEKKLEGTIIGIIVGTLGALWFVPFWPAFLGALAAMIVDHIDFGELQINDNVLIPLVAGLVMFAVMLI